MTIGQGNTGGGNFGGTIADNDGVHPGGSVALQIIGTGEWTLSGTNTYSGGTILGGATTLNLVNSSAIGTGQLTINGGSLDNNSGNPVVLGNIPQTWNGSSIGYFGGSLLNLGRGPVTVNVPTTLNVVQSSGTLEIDGNITSGTSAVSTAGPGTVVLAGSSNISAVNGANVASFAAANTISTGSLTLTGGNFTLQPSATFTVAGGLVSESAAAGGVGTVIGNGAGGTAYMVVSGGTFQQGPNGLLYAGQHSLGVLTIQGNGIVALGAAPLAFSYNGGIQGTLDLNGGTLQSSGFVSQSNVGGQTLNFNGGVLELTASSTNLFGTSQADFTSNIQNGMIVNLNGFSSTINDALIGSGSGGLTVTSAAGGSLTLTGTNTYVGGTYVEGNGTLIVTNPASIDGNNLGTTGLFVGNDLSAFGGLVAAGAGSVAGQTAAAPVPEPGTLAILAAAGTFLVLLRSKKKRRCPRWRRESPVINTNWNRTFDFRYSTFSQPAVAAGLSRAWTRRGSRSRICPSRVAESGNVHPAPCVV